MYECVGVEVDIGVSMLSACVSVYTRFRLCLEV